MIDIGDVFSSSRPFSRRHAEVVLSSLRALYSRLPKSHRLTMSSQPTSIAEPRYPSRLSLVGCLMRQASGSRARSSRCDRITLPPRHLGCRCSRLAVLAACCAHHWTPLGL